MHCRVSHAVNKYLIITSKNILCCLDFLFHFSWTVRETSALNRREKNLFDVIAQTTLFTMKRVLECMTGQLTDEMKFLTSYIARFSILLWFLLLGNFWRCMLRHYLLSAYFTFFSLTVLRIAIILLKRHHFALSLENSFSIDWSTFKCLLLSKARVISRLCFVKQWRVLHFGGFSWIDRPPCRPAVTRSSQSAIVIKTNSF